MKTITLTLFTVFFTLCTSAQQGIVWESEIVVADGDAYGNVRPRISLSGETPLVMLGKSGNGEIFIARGNGTGFVTPVGIVPAGMQTYLANWTGPDIASNGNNVVVVFKEQDIVNGNIYAVRSTDGGITFSDTIRVDNYDQGQVWMPALDMDENGNPHVTYMIFAPGGGSEQIVVASSTDGGLSYQPQQVVSNASPGHACDCCPPEIVVNGQYQLALFRNNDANIRDIWGSLSTDGGTSFASIANLDNLNWQINSCPSTGPHGVIIGDSAYTVSASRGEGSYRVYVSTSGLNGGLNLNSVEMMLEPTTSAGDVQNYPRISGSGDTLVVVWEEKILGNADVCYSVTTDGNTQTLGAFKAVVNDNLAGTQGKPDVVFKNGVVHVVYQDLSSNDVIYRKGTISDFTHVGELEDISVDVYPNPTHRFVTLDGISEDFKKISLVDANGKDIPFALEQLSGAKVQLDLGEEIQAGTYFLNLLFANGTAVAKQVVVK